MQPQASPQEPFQEIWEDKALQCAPLSGPLRHLLLLISLAIGPDTSIYLWCCCSDYSSHLPSPEANTHLELGSRGCM